MAKFLTTLNANAAIEDIVRKANENVVLISPYIKIPPSLLERFKEADVKNIKITLVCQKLKDEERDNLSNIAHLDLRFLKSLHAKCFYNQESMVITSQNLYESIHKQNKEMGILLTQKEDKETFMDALREANLIVNNATPDKASNMNRVKLSNTDVNDKPRSHKLIEKGYCIRGGERIPFDCDNPYCFEHREKWAEYKNSEYKEHYCHRCGERHRTSFSKPLCLSCLKKQ